jgi:hypothetical protein
LDSKEQARITRVVGGSRSEQGGLVKLRCRRAGRRRFFGKVVVASFI